MTTLSESKDKRPTRARSQSTFRQGHRASTAPQDVQDAALITSVYLEVSESELAAMTVRELNAQIRIKGLTVDQAKMVKHMRRTLKNRGYAAVCRSRRSTQRHQLQEKAAKLRYQNDQLRLRNEDLAADVHRVNRDLTGLLGWCVDRGIPVPEDMRPPIGWPAPSWEWPQ